MNSMASDKEWKPSFFNIGLDGAATRLFFNSRSAQMLELSGEQIQIFEDWLREIKQSGSCSNHRMLRCLAALGFIVQDDEDEYESEHARFLATQISKDTLRVTIAPTMACNLRCSYCFQQNMRRCKTMRPDIQRGVVEFIRRTLEGSRLLVVQWFGGEPLLAYKQIQAMSAEFQEICQMRNIAYYSEMLTNGTLLTPKLIDSFPQIALKAIQIPLDGDVPTYAARKKVPLEWASAYHRFLVRHMQSLVDATGSVTIRINVDRENEDAGRSVVRMFKENGVTDRRIDFRLGFLNTSRGVIECIPHDCFSSCEFSQTEVEFMHFLAREGYRVYGRPNRRNFPCSAAIGNSYTIDSEGGIGKCVPATGMTQSVFARIYPDDINRTLREINSREMPYARFDPFTSSGCRSCKLLPVCLGSCPKMHEPGATLNCVLKEGLASRLRFYLNYPA